MIIYDTRFPEKEEEGVAPHFVSPLKPLVIEKHQPGLLECTVSGSPLPEVKWYQGETEVKPKEGKTEITFTPETGKAVLRILEPTPEDETIYRVRAINKFGKAECRANLLISSAPVVSQPEILHAPRITQPLPANVAQKGESLTLSIEFQSDIKPEVKWYRNNVEIKPSTDRTMNTFKSTAELIIPEIQKEDTGKYEVRIQNAAGEARSSGSLAVREKDKTDKAKAPRFIQAIHPQVVTEGEVVIMETTVDSYPISSFQWLHENHPLVVSIHYIIIPPIVLTVKSFLHFINFQSSHEIRIVTKENRSVLMIKQLKPESTGTYTCRAENVVGSVTSSATINLQKIPWEETVELASPNFAKRLSPIRVMDGESVNLTCTVTGKPTPRIEWFHDSKPIREGKQITILQDSEGVCNLSITEVFPEDAGEYTCQAVNPVGEAVCTAPLVVEGNK